MTISYTRGVRLAACNPKCGRRNAVQCVIITVFIVLASKSTNKLSLALSFFCVVLK